MATYLEKIAAAQKGIDSTYGLLNIYKNSRSNNGWIGTNPSDINLSKFNTYFSENNIVKLNDSIDATLFDIPMSTMGYDKYGNFGAGIPSDIGFTRNVEQNEYGSYIPHPPLYKIINGDTIEAYASNNADINIGGKVKYRIVDNGIEVFPNGSSESFISAPDSEYFDPEYIFPIVPVDDSNHLHMLYAFVSINYQNGGIMLFVTPNFITWNTHCILSPDADWHETWHRIFDHNEDNMSLIRSSENISIVENIISKYFRVLPNNNYLIMRPEDISNAAGNNFPMVKMYSLWNKDPLLIIMNPYNFDYDNIEGYLNVIYNGFSSFMTENGEIVLYYNNSGYTPLVLYNGRTMGTFTGEVSDNYRHEIIESPKVAKIYDMQIDKTAPYTKTVDNMAMDCAVSILESKNKKLTNDDIPAASVQLALGDIGRPYIDNMLDEISLHVDKSIDMMNNIDVDFSDYIYAKNNNGQDYLEKDSDLQNNDIQLMDCNTKNGEIIETLVTNICYGNGKYIIFNDDGTIIYSNDGIVWEYNYSPYYYSSFYNFGCYGDNKFITIGNTESGSFTDGELTFNYSTDGIEWTNISVSNIDTSKHYICSLCYGNGKFVAIKSYSSIIYSNDGFVWNEVDISNFNKNWYDVCYGDGKFVAIAADTAEIITFIYSIDGINWTECIASGMDLAWYSICYGNGKFVAVGSNVPYADTPVVAHSTNGVDWTVEYIDPYKYYDFSDGGYSYYDRIRYGNGKYIVIDGSCNVIYSTNAIDWIYIDNIEDNYNEIPNIGYGNGKFILTTYSTIKYLDSIDFSIHSNISNNNKLTILSDPSLYNSNVRYRSSIIGNTLETGININNIDTWVESNISDTTRMWTSVCYGDGKFIAFGIDNVSAYSIDGINWTEVTVSDISRDWESVCYGDGKFVAISCDDNIFAYSTDGINWTEGTISDNYRYWESVCYGNGKFVAVTAYDGDNVSAYSTDGINWIECAISDNYRSWASVCYGDGKFVAVGYGDSFAYSIDGITWTEVTVSYYDRFYRSICYGDGKFVAVAYESIFAYSTDGINWTEGTISDVERTWVSVCYGNGKYVAVAYYSNIFVYSTDGITWTEGTISNTKRNWESVCYGNDKFVAVDHDNISACFSKFINILYKDKNNPSLGNLY